jgi:hypothetical protein
MAGAGAGVGVAGPRALTSHPAQPERIAATRIRPAATGKRAGHHRRIALKMPLNVFIADLPLVRQTVPYHTSDVWLKAAVPLHKGSIPQTCAKAKRGHAATAIPLLLLPK